MGSSVQIEINMSRDDGYLAFYARFRQGKIHTTHEIAPGLNVDVDREGRVLGVEVIRTSSTRLTKKCT